MNGRVINSAFMDSRSGMRTQINGGVRMVQNYTRSGIVFPLEYKNWLVVKIDLLGEAYGFFDGEFGNGKLLEQFFVQKKNALTSF